MYGQHFEINEESSRFGNRKNRSSQTDLIILLGAAASAAGLDRDGWRCQPQGDGEMALLPAGEPGVRVLDDYVQHLHSALRHHNDDRSAATALRLRMAMHHGVVRPADNGFAGAAPVLVGRLLGSAPLRAGLEASQNAPLAVLLSDQLYRDLVAAGHTVVRPGEFRAVAVAEKEVHDRAWLRVPGVDVHALDLGSQPPDPERAGAATVPRGGVHQDAVVDHGNRVTQAGRDACIDHSGDTVTNTFHGEVDAREATFGFAGDRRRRDER